MLCRHYFIPRVHATTFYRYHGEIETVAYNPDFLRRHPDARAAALPWAVPRRFRVGWTFDPYPGGSRESGQPEALGAGLFVVPFLDGRYTIAQVVDVGPWTVEDPYWREGRRPMAESWYKSRGTVYSPQRGERIRVTNPAGVDFTPAVWVDLGINEELAYSERFSAVVDLAIIERW